MTTSSDEPTPGPPQEQRQPSATEERTSPSTPLRQALSRGLDAWGALRVALEILLLLISVWGIYKLYSWEPTITPLAISDGNPLRPTFVVENTSWFTMKNTLGALYPGSGRVYTKGGKPDLTRPFHVEGPRGPCNSLTEYPIYDDLRTSGNTLVRRQELSRLAAGSQTTFAPKFTFDRTDMELILGVAVQYELLWLTRKACQEFRTVLRDDGTFTMVPHTTTIVPQ